MKRQNSGQPTAIIFYGGFFSRAGGAFMHAAAMQKELRALGWDASIVCLDSLPFLFRYLPHAIEKLVNLVWMPLGFYYKGRVTRLLYRWFVRRRADLYVFEDVYLAWNSRVPSICILHAVWSDNLQAFEIRKKRVKSLIRKEAVTINRIEHSVVTVSVPYLEYLNKHFAGAALYKRIDVIELGLDSTGFPPRTEAWNPRKLIYCGALEARKNVRFMLEAFCHVAKAAPDATLTILGDGPEQPALEAFAFAHGLKVDFRGRCTHEVVVTELLAHSIYLHTSTKESFSFALLEAKLCGLTTFAVAGLEVPAEFVDEPVEGFDAQQWAHRILARHSPAVPKDLSRFSRHRMVERALQSAGLPAATWSNRSAATRVTPEGEQPSSIYSG